MLEENGELFDEFGEIHAKYSLNRRANQADYNRVGEKVIKVVEACEHELCRHSEKGQFAKYSHSLAEKFREELKKDYPMIDFVGVKITTAANVIEKSLDKLTKTQLID